VRSLNKPLVSPHLECKGWDRFLNGNNNFKKPGDDKLENICTFEQNVTQKWQLFNVI